MPASGYSSLSPLLMTTPATVSGDSASMRGASGPSTSRRCFRARSRFRRRLAADAALWRLACPCGAARRSASCAGCSRTTSRARLSSRRPSNDGWRSVPSRVHSVNVTSPTSSGLTQCARRPSAPRRRIDERRLVASRACAACGQRRQQRVVEPGADLAAVAQRPFRRRRRAAARRSPSARPAGRCSRR